MSPYNVIASNPQTAIVVLEDGAGKVHLARALVETPPPGTVLVGEAPALGVVALKRPTGEELMPVAMVMLDCDVVVAVKLIEVTARTTPTKPDPADAESPRIAGQAPDS